MLGSSPGVKLLVDEADEGVDGVAKTLLEEAEGAPTLISVISRGLGAVQRARLGSVSTKVIRAARDPSWSTLTSALVRRRQTGADEQGVSP